MSNPFGSAPGINPGMPVQSVTHAPPAMASADDKIRVVVGPFVLSYPSLFVPKAKMGEKLQPGQQATMRFSGEFMVYAASPEAGAIYQKLTDAANTVAMQKFGKTTDSPIFRNKPVRNLAEREKYQGPAGFFITANSSQKPSIVVGDPPTACTDPDELYAGCLVYINVAPSAYDVDGSKGVKWFLNSVWKVGEGPRLAVERDGTSDFAHLVGKVAVNVAPSGYGAQQAPPAAEMPPWMLQQAAPVAPQYAVPPGYAAPPQQYAAPPQYQMPPGMPPMPGHWAPPQ